MTRPSWQLLGLRDGREKHGARLLQRLLEKSSAGSESDHDAGAGMDVDGSSATHDLAQA